MVPMGYPRDWIAGLLRPYVATWGDAYTYSEAALLATCVIFGAAMGVLLGYWARGRRETGR